MFGSPYDSLLNQQYLSQQAMNQCMNQQAAQSYWTSAQTPEMLQNTSVNHNPDERLLVLLTEE